MIKEIREVELPRDAPRVDRAWDPVIGWTRPPKPVLWHYTKKPKKQTNDSLDVICGIIGCAILMTALYIMGFVRV